jgi:signal transduction histidine kinase
MPAELATRLRSNVRRAVIVSGAAVLVAGGLVLVGWATGAPSLQALGPFPIAMLPTTATGFIAAGAAVILLAAFPGSTVARIARIALSAYVVLLGGLTFLERLFEIDFGIDLLLFEQAVRAAPWKPHGRMAINSAMSFALLGISLLLLDRPGRRNRQAAQGFALAAFLIAFLAILGYAYGVGPLYTVGQFSGGMAFVTAVSFAVLSLSVIFARSTEGLAALFTNDRASGVFSRRLAPAAILVPVVLGWLLLGVRREGWVDESVGVAGFAAMVFALFLLLLIRSARAVERLDREREALLEDARKARADAEAANRAKTQFLTSMSHELRTPLNAIAGYVQLLDLGVHGPVNEAQREALTRTQRSQQHLLALINDVLNFAKLDAGRVEFRMAPVPLGDVLNAIEAMVLPQLGSKSLHFSIRCDELGLAVMADREKLQQILLNLLSNAIKFTPIGGRISLECSTAGHLLRIAVRDTGVGIAPQALESIFEPFVQVDRSLTNLTEGAGLGLAISRELARGMGGELVAESVHGEGSTFTLSLTRAPQHEPPTSRPDEAPVLVA